MVISKGKASFIIFLLILGLMAVGCVRTLPGSGDENTTDTTTETGDQGAVGPDVAAADTGEPDAGAAETADIGTEEAADTPRDDASGDTAVEDADTTKGEETSGETDAVESGGDVTKEESADVTAETGEPAAEDSATSDTTDESADDTVKTDTPGTHTVAAGENLYQIGLKYGVSWVTLADVNNLSNPNRITVGQTLQIPSGDSEANVSPEVTPSPLTETTYTVKAGDNLFRVGLAYGISWVQIAEANGIVNPNQIVVGDVLKIPVDTPGPAPQFTHEVKPGENLFLISVQYGVTWTKIAEANDIGSPYVIYPGQTLVIPGE